VSVSIPFGDVERMLKVCAEGYTIRFATHCHVVTYNGLVFRGLPDYKDLQINHVRKLVRSLQINRECAEAQLPKLKKH